MYFPLQNYKAMIEALKNTIGNHICIKGCFCHLTQSTHRKIQNFGFENMYKNNNDFSIFCRKLESLALLPENKVLEGMNFLYPIALLSVALLSVAFLSGYYLNYRCMFFCSPRVLVRGLVHTIML